MRRLDRYVMIYFLQAYFYCIAGFISIWFIFDVSDNISTFLDQRISRMLILKYYLTQVPQILVILFPVALLLALLFSLGRMSRSNEIVSMLTAGVSLPRILAPLLFIGLLTTATSTALNYSLAPHGEYAHKRLLEDPASRRQLLGMTAQIFRNRTDNRTWFIQQFFPGDNKFTTVHIVQQDANDNIVKAYIATTAFYHPESHTWQFDGVKVVDYDTAGNIVNVDYHVGDPLLISDWSETPFRLSSANVRAEHLSVPELRDYLEFNSDFPATLLAPFATHLQYRIALPWTCIVVALIAGSLGVGYSRRGILSSVAAAILLIFAMNFAMHLFLALGEGARVPTWAAAWTPNIIFGIVGLILLYYRATNREPPRLAFLRTSSVIAR
ncbi:MAG TPA: LptF/LptG family permease [Chthoniobacterales bacterium]|jgi:LPS export ABC transporter permease LptG|nr:LptF/LptG family permease [Chthoniobacterales bacterium]